MTFSGPRADGHILMIGGYVAEFTVVVRRRGGDGGGFILLYGISHTDRQRGQINYIVIIIHRITIGTEM